jgi:hypothetical protein
MAANPQTPAAHDLGAAAIAPAIIRGAIIDTDLIEFGGRNDALRFLAPDPATLIKRLPMGNPQKLTDLHALSVQEILDYLCELGGALDITRNTHLQQALALSIHTAPTTPPLLRHQYSRLPGLFSSEDLEDVVRGIGRPYLEGWVEEPVRANGARRQVRAFGARALHIVAGNSPILSAMTVIRNALTRGDAIVKAPSNDPFTAIALVRTMIDMAPTHPITRHISVAYWRGGDEAFESKLYQPHNIEKIVAWGGMSSIKHVVRYIQPGLELISLDPKRSISVVGAAAFADDATMDAVAVRIAADVGAQNQEACANSRVVYVQSGTDEAGIARLVELGERVYRELLALPERTSTAPKYGINRDLKQSLDAAGMQDDFYHVVGGRKNEGAVIVSKLPEPVDFAPSLTNRVANLVPVDRLDEIYPRMDSYCQTVGVYPEWLVPQIRDPLAIAGAQRLVSLGYAGASTTGFGGPQDGIEPIRRLCKWIFREEADPVKTPTVWRH